MIQIPDSDILLAIRQGNERVYETVFRKYYQTLCNYACGILKDIDDAEEVVQSIFLKLWEQREVIEINVSLKSYLYRAVHNTCMNRLKHLKIQDSYRQYVGKYLEDTFDSATDMMSKNELQNRISQALEKLPEQCRIIFKMSRFEELKYQEIADKLGLSIKTIENQIGKALRIMRTELSDYLPVMLIFIEFLNRIIV